MFRFLQLLIDIQSTAAIKYHNKQNFLNPTENIELEYLVKGDIGKKEVKLDQTNSVVFSMNYPASSSYRHCQRPQSKQNRRL